MDMRTCVCVCVVLAIYQFCCGSTRSFHHRRQSWPCRPSRARWPLWTQRHSERTSTRCRRTCMCSEIPERWRQRQRRGWMIFFLGGGAWENTDGLTLKLTLLRTRLASAVLMALSNWRRTWRASWGVICWVWTHTHTFISLNLRFLNNKQLKEMVGTRDHCSKTQSQVNIRRRNHWIYFTCTGANEMRWTRGQQQDNTHKQECCNSWWHTEQKQRITFVCVVTLLILYPVPKIIAQQTGGCAATIW